MRNRTLLFKNVKKISPVNVLKDRQFEISTYSYEVIKNFGIDFKVVLYDKEIICLVIN